MNKVTTKIYLLKDSHGNKTSAVCEEGCDTVQVCGMLNKAGDKTYFESEGYHLDSFCRNNDIQIKIIEREENFDDLWNSK